MKMYLSIIIPAYNERELISGCLDSVLNQNADPSLFEILVIDNNSMDGTASIARSKGIRVETEIRKGYGYALQKGVTASVGDILAFLDADCRAPANWVTKILHHFAETPEIVALGGKLYFYDIFPLFNWVAKLVTSSVVALPGNNMVIRRRALERIGGFDPTINLALDYWLTLKLKQVGRIKIDKNLVMHTSPRRFKRALLSNFPYAANVISMSLLNRPTFLDFPDVRES